MRTVFWSRAAIISAALAGALWTGPTGLGSALAHEIPADFVLSCENGRSYPIRARAVTVDGDLVTGYVLTGRHHGTHVRLVPMGAGYRYAAYGQWVDGWRHEAAINFGRSTSVPCSVSKP